MGHCVGHNVEQDFVLNNVKCGLVVLTAAYC